MTRDGQDIPEGSIADILRFVQALMGGVPQHPPTLLPGELPEAWPGELTPGPPARVLGGMLTGQGMVAVFAYPPSVREAFADYRAMVERAGWAPSKDLFHTPMESSMTAFHARDGDLLMMTRPHDDAHGLTVAASLNPGAAAQHAERMQGFPPDPGIEIPRMRSPDSVRYDSGGGGGGGGDHKHVHIRLVSDLPPADLLPYYVGELERAGWKAGAAHVTSESATRWFEATDDHGRTWRGPLVVYAMDGAHEVFLYMATATPDPRWIGAARRRPHPSSL